MSAVVKLSGKLPGDPEINGLDHWRDQLEDHPADLIAAVVLIDCAQVTVDTDTGAHVPTARVRRIEVLGPVADVPAAVKKAMADAEQKRTGRKAIPFEVVEVERSADPYGDELPEDGGE